MQEQINIDDSDEIALAKAQALFTCVLAEPDSVVSEDMLDKTEMLFNALMDGMKSFPADDVRFLIQNLYKLITENHTVRARLQECINYQITQAIRMGRPNFAHRS